MAACLHCAIHRPIREAYPDGIAVASVLGDLAQVVAEIAIAASPEHAHQIDRAFAGSVAVMIAIKAPAARPPETADAEVAVTVPGACGHG